MQGGGRRRRQIVDHINTFRPDVAVLTEYRDANSHDLRTMLTDIGLQHQIRTADPEGGYAAALLASRQPLTPGPVTLGLDPPTSRWIHATIEHTAWDIACCLIPAGGSGPQRAEKGEFWDAILDNEPQLRERPTIITGDFNTGRHHIDETGATFQAADRLEAILERGWTDAFRQLHGDVPAPTWWSPGHHNGFRLDHTLLSPGSPPPLGSHYQTNDSNGERICGPGKGMTSDHAVMITDLPNQ